MSMDTSPSAPVAQTAPGPQIESCPFCKGQCVDVSPVPGSTTIFYPYVQCVRCQYTSPSMGRIEDAIEAHNRVSRILTKIEGMDLGAADRAGKSRREMAGEEATANPIFVLERHVGRGHWQSESVFYSRDEGEAWAREHKHWFTKNLSRDFNPPRAWRVYCVPARGMLADLLGRTERKNSDN